MVRACQNFVDAFDTRVLNRFVLKCCSKKMVESGSNDVSGTLVIDGVCFMDGKEEGELITCELF